MTYHNVNRSALREAVFFVAVFALLFVGAVAALQNLLDLPIVQQDTATRECVRILMVDGEHPCTELPNLGRYVVEYVAPVEAAR